MTPHIVQSPFPVTLLGGGEATSQDVKEALSHAPAIIAADGGTSMALELGQMPIAVIGDMDSIDSESRARIPADRLHLISEQNSTDFDKCLRNIHAPMVLGVGFTGLRIDHQLAAFSTLLRYPQKPCILLARDEVIFLAPAEMTIGLPVGSRVSLFPLRTGRVTASGLRWPLGNMQLKAGAQIGTSNEVARETVKLKTDHPGILVLLPRAALASAIQAVLAAQLHAPAPAL